MGLVLKDYTIPIRAKKVPTATTAKKAFIAMINIDRYVSTPVLNDK